MIVQQNKIPDRVVLYTRDVQNITGLSESAARRLLQRIRQLLVKTSDEFVTIRDFCTITGIEEDLVKDFLKM